MGTVVTLCTYPQNGRFVLSYLYLSNIHSLIYRSMDLIGPKGHRIPPPTSRRWHIEPHRLSSTLSLPSEREPSQPTSVMLAPDQWYISSPSSQGSPAINVVPPRSPGRWRPSEDDVAFIERVTMGGNRLAIRRAQNVAAGRYSIGLQPKPSKVRGRAKSKRQGRPPRASESYRRYDLTPIRLGAVPP